MQLPQGMAMNIEPHAGQALTHLNGLRPNWYTVDIILTFDFPHA